MGAAIGAEAEARAWSAHFVHPREVESHVWVQACNIGGIPKVFDGGHKGPHTAIVSRFDLLRDELIYLQTKHQCKGRLDSATAPFQSPNTSRAAELILIGSDMCPKNAKKWQLGTHITSRRNSNSKNDNDNNCNINDDKKQQQQQQQLQ